MHCPKCESATYVKSGFKDKRQRYKCKKCGCNFTQSHLRNYPFKIKFQAAKLYLEGVGLRSIGRLLGVCNVTVLNWIRQFGLILRDYVQERLPKDIHDIEYIEMDEMWHFTAKKNGRSGSGLLSKDVRRKSLGLHWEVGVKKPLNISFPR